MAKDAKKKAKANSAKTSETKSLKAGALSDEEVEALRKSFRRVLRNKGVTQPVEIQLATAGGNLRLVWECTTLDDGTEECVLVDDAG